MNDNKQEAKLFELIAEITKSDILSLEQKAQRLQALFDYSHKMDYSQDLKGLLGRQMVSITVAQNNVRKIGKLDDMIPDEHREITDRPIPERPQEG